MSPLLDVKGLTIHDKGRTFKVITGTLEELGYTVFYKVLNSRDYGVPQNRERIYIVAFRNLEDCDKFHYPESIPLTKKVSDIIDIKKKQNDIYYYNNERINLKLKMSPIKYRTRIQLI